MIEIKSLSEYIKSFRNNFPEELKNPHYSGNYNTTYPINLYRQSICTYKSFITGKHKAVQCIIKAEIPKNTKIFKYSGDLISIGPNKWTYGSFIINDKYKIKSISHITLDNFIRTLGYKLISCEPLNDQSLNYKKNGIYKDILMNLNYKTDRYYRFYFSKNEA